MDGPLVCRLLRQEHRWVPKGSSPKPLSDESRRRLLEARAALLRTVALTDEELVALDRPQPSDPPEHAASASAASLLARLGGREKRQLDEIADALRRLARGVYGACEWMANDAILGREEPRTTAQSFYRTVMDTSHQGDPTATRRAAAFAASSCVDRDVSRLPSADHARPRRVQIVRTGSALFIV